MHKMAPTPPSDPPLPFDIPHLHLQILDVSHPGSQRFFSHTSSPHDLLHRSVRTVLEALYPPSLLSSDKNKEIGPPAIRSVTLFVREFDGVAHTHGSRLDELHKEVHVSSSYLAKVGGESKRIKQEIEGVVVHELVHAFQFNGKGTCDGGVIEGIADWVRLKAGLGPPHWRAGSGDRWNGGYETTAFFLAFLESHLSNPLLVPELNLALRDHEWDDGKLLKKVLGWRDVEELWKVYKKTLEKGEKGGEPAKAVPTHGPVA
ncbi:hypothetical protein MNV49_002595 [Pseudohyphozyma bogoriensis]|nr:hypothetical protein MNV49_002595 [Pseudohyphozyma bogoriensis]